MNAVIIAAGRSSRLAKTTHDTPKTLLPFGHDTILSTILGNLHDVGVERFVVVVGYQKERILRYLRQNNNFGWSIAVVENEEWQRGNGISVLAAEGAIGTRDFVLSMSDHIVSHGALSRIIQDKRSTSLLLVDPRIDGIHDLEDATKVDVEGTRIRDIGKDLNSYNAIDCGIFRLQKTFFTAMGEMLRAGHDSISAGIGSLIARREIEAVFVEADDSWIDIDTSEAYDWALRSCATLLRGFSTAPSGTGLSKDRRR